MTSSAADKPASGPPLTVVQPQIKNSACLDCHSDNTLYKTNAARQAVSLFIDEKRFMSTVHKTNSCASCHADITMKHPDDDIPARPVNCAQCHDAQARQYAYGIHGAQATSWGLPARPVASIATQWITPMSLGTRTTCYR